MFAKTAIAAALISLGTLAAPANAANFNMQFGYGSGHHQGYHQGNQWGQGGNNWNWQHQQHRPQRLSAEEIRWMLRDSGYHAVRFFDSRGPVYQLTARKYGRSYFLVVSARTGDILSAQRI